MVKKRVWVIGAIVLLVLAGAFYFLYTPFKESGDFSKTSLIRINMPLGGSSSNPIVLNNPNGITQTLNIYLEGLEEIATLSKNEVVLDPKGSEEISVNFVDKDNVSDVYVGEIIVEGSSSRQEIPVIVGVEDPNHAFAIILSSLPRYDFVYKGGKLGVDVKVFDLINANVPVVDANYYVKNFEGETLLSGTTKLSVDSGSKTELVDIPEDWELGDYVFVLEIDYKETISFASFLFSVSSSEEENIFGGSNMFFILISVFVVLVLGFVIYFVKARDSLMLELKKQQSSELKRNLNYIKHSKKSIQKSDDKPHKKKEKLKKLDNAKKSAIKKLKEKQKKQEKEIRNLKKKKTHKGKIKGKMNKWKKEGYKMYEADKALKKSGKGVNDSLKEWKKQGYDTSFLNK